MLKGVRLSGASTDNRTSPSILLRPDRSGTIAYMEFSLIDGKLVDGKFVRIPKSSDFRALSCAFLKNNDVMEGSIISSVQYRMINKGIVI